MLKPDRRTAGDEFVTHGNVLCCGHSQHRGKFSTIGKINILVTTSVFLRKTIVSNFFCGTLVYSFEETPKASA